MHPLRSPDARRPSTLAWLGCYAAWIVLSAVSLPLFWLIRTNMLDIARLQELSSYTVGTIDRFGTVILGLLWLMGVIVLESWLRSSVTRYRLVSRVVRTSIVLAILFGVSLLLDQLL